MGVRQAGPVEILIDELVLTGFDPRDRLTIGDALQFELGRLVSEQGLPSGLLDRTESPRPLSFKAGPARKPAELGLHIARSVYEGLGDQTNAKGMKDGR